MFARILLARNLYAGTSFALCATVPAIVIWHTRYSWSKQDSQRHIHECVPSSQPSRQQAVDVRKVDFLLFPVDATIPRVVHVDCRMHHKDAFGGEEYLGVDWHKLFGACISGFAAHPVGTANPVSQSAPPSRLFLAFGDYGPFDSAPQPANLCAQHLTRGQSRVPWAGNLIGYRSYEPSASSTQFLDVSMEDLPQFVAFLKTYRSPLPRSPIIRSINPSELLAMLSGPTGHNCAAYFDGDVDFSSTAAEFVVRERIVPPKYPSTSRRVAQPEEELGAQSEMLKNVIREEVRAAIWETGITIVAAFLGAYGLWRFVLSPSISFFVAVLLFFLPAPFTLIKLFLWPLTLFKFGLM
uniref:N/A n=1 Tax=Ganoderma boninense TaxID=34458 RepID=A0A5K1K3C4_9APHY|nr:N/A [Ganoderma boninense]